MLSKSTQLIRSLVIVWGIGAKQRIWMLLFIQFFIIHIKVARPMYNAEKLYDTVSMRDYWVR